MENFGKKSLMDGNRMNLSFIESFQKGSGDTIIWEAEDSSVQNGTVSLLAHVDSPLYMNFAIDFQNDRNGSTMTREIGSLMHSLPLRHSNRIALHHNFTVRRHAKGHEIARLESEYGGTLTCGELSTIMALHQTCTDLVDRGENALVFYIHSKGTCCSRSTNNPPNWREFMNTFIVEFPSICINALLDGYSTCGVNYRPYTNNTSIPPHYSGSFWWSRCDYIATLPAPTKTEGYDAYAAEWFPLTISKDFVKRRMFGDQCSKNIHDSNIYFYQKYTRDNYIHLVHEALNNDSLHEQARIQSKSRQAKWKACNDYGHMLRKES